MKKLYTHENRLIVFNIKNLLEDEGIDCLIKNEYASGGAGDLVPIETWPEVWVSDDSQFERAQQVLSRLFSDQLPTHEWICSHCHETNDSNFELCWNCSQPRLKPSSIPDPC